MNDQIRQYQFLFDNMTHGAFFQDADGTLTDVNKAALDMFGLSRDEFLSRTSNHPEWRVIDLHGNPLPPEQCPSMVSLQHGECVRDFIAGIYHPQRQEFVWLQINATPMFRQGEERPYRAFATLVDITAQRQATLALAQSEEKYRQLHETMNDGFAMVDMNGTIREWNESFRLLLGYQDDEIGRLTYRDITPEQWHDEEARIVSEEVMQRGYSRVYEKEYIHKDGTVFPVELRTCLTRDHLGNPSGMWAIIRDISDRKKMEKALRDSEERYRRFIATANEGIGISNSSYILTYVNRCLAEMLGYEADELIGRHIASLLPPDELDTFTVTMADRHQGISGQRECRHRRKDGSVIWLLTSSTPILDESGTFQGCFAMFTDLTGIKNAEVVLQRANDELELRVAERTSALARANDQILKISFELVRAQEQERSRIAAELHDQVGQTLLLAKMKLDMLASKTGSPVESNYIEDIVTLLESSIHDIRTLTFSMRPPLLETAGLEAAFEWLCTSIENDYNLQIEFCRICRPISLAGEQRYSFFQSVRELLLNVAKHAGVDRAKLSLYSENNNLIVRVSDEGTGFAGIGESPCSESNGGCGLFNVQQRIELLGGSIAIVTSPGKGTAVTLTVPLENQRREREPWN